MVGLYQHRARSIQHDSGIPARWRPSIALNRLHFTGSSVRATRIAAGVGQFIAVAFIVIGLLRFFSGAGFGGLWIAFIGWFLLQASAASYAEIETSAALPRVRVGDVMAEDCPTVDGNVNLRTFADDYLLRTGRRYFAVLQNGRELGW